MGYFRGALLFAIHNYQRGDYCTCPDMTPPFFIGGERKDEFRQLYAVNVDALRMERRFVGVRPARP